MKRARSERMHPAVWPAALMILVTVGRLPELLPFLAPLQLGKVAFLGVLLALAVGPRDVGNAPVLERPLGKLVLAWFLFAALSVVWSVWGSHSLEFLVTGMLNNVVLFYVLARTTTNVRTLRFHVGFVLASGAMLALTAIAARGLHGRVSASSTYDPNDLAMVLIIVLSLAVALLFAARGKWRLLLLSFCGILLVAILLTGSRGGFLGLIAVACYLFWARLPATGGAPGPRFRPLKLVAAGLGVIVLLASIPTFVWDRIESLTTLEDDYNVTGSTGRLAIWGRGLEAMAARPWGWGLAAFESVEGKHGGGRYKAAHNIWIEIGVELGVQGVVILAGVMICFLRIANRVRDNAARDGPPDAWSLPVAIGLHGAMIGFLVTGFFLSKSDAGVLFAMTGLFAGLEYVANRPVEQDAAAGSTPEPGAAPPKAPPLAARDPALRPVGGRRSMGGGHSPPGSRRRHART